MRQSIVLLNSTQGQINVTGPAVQGASYYGSGINYFTFAVYCGDFSGNVYLQATLANDPCCLEADWFDVNLEGLTPYSTSTNYLEFLPMTPDMYGQTGFTGIVPFSLNGNYVFLRLVIDRTTLPDYETTDYGLISKALVNY